MSRVHHHTILDFSNNAFAPKYGKTKPPPAVPRTSLPPPPPPQPQPQPQLIPEKKHKTHILIWINLVLILLMGIGFVLYETLRTKEPLSLQQQQQQQQQQQHIRSQNQFEIVRIPFTALSEGNISIKSYGKVVLYHICCIKNGAYICKAESKAIPINAVLKGDTIYTQILHPDAIGLACTLVLQCVQE